MTTLPVHGLSCETIPDFAAQSPCNTFRCGSIQVWVSTNRLKWVPVQRSRIWSRNDRLLAGFLLLLGIGILAGLSRTDSSQIPAHGPRPAAGDEPVSAKPESPKASGGEDFRFLLAILTGVVLGAATLSLQSELPSVRLTIPFIGQVVLWAASLAATVLMYLSILYGSRLTAGHVGAAETTLLICIALSECGLFVCVTLGPGSESARRWFAFLSIFSFLAVCGISAVRRRIAKWPPRGLPTEVIRLYRKSLRRDVTMAAIEAIGAAAYAISARHPSGLNVLMFGNVFLVFLVAANFQQASTRRKLTRAKAI